MQSTTRRSTFTKPAAAEHGDAFGMKCCVWNKIARCSRVTSHDDSPLMSRLDSSKRLASVLTEIPRPAPLRLDTPHDFQSRLPLLLWPMVDRRNRTFDGISPPKHDLHHTPSRKIHLMSKGWRGRAPNEHNNGQQCTSSTYIHTRTRTRAHSSPPAPHQLPPHTRSKHGSLSRWILCLGLWPRRSLAICFRDTAM